MIYRHQPDSYHPSHYDEDYCLKAPYLLWLATLWLSRGTLLPLVAGLGHYARVEANALVVMRGLWRADELIPAMFSTPVLYALIRRSPRSSPVVRWIWTQGRTFITLAAVLDIALAIYSLRPYSEVGDQAFVVCATCLLDAYFMLYVLVARRIRDTFADFPQP